MKVRNIFIVPSAVASAASGTEESPGDSEGSLFQIPWLKQDGAEPEGCLGVAGDMSCMKHCPCNRRGKPDVFLSVMLLFKYIRTVCLNSKSVKRITLFCNYRA